MFDLICFDYDGVLVDSFDRLQNVVDKARLQIGHGRMPIPSDFQNDPNLSFESVGINIGIPEELIPQYMKAVFNIQSSLLDLPICFEGMPELIKTTSHSTKTAIITGSAQTEVDGVLKREGLTKNINFLYDGVDPRPKTEKILEIIKILTFKPERVLMVGDARTDIRSGQHAGVKTLAVSWGYQPLDFLRLEKPDYTVATVQEFYALLAPPSLS